MKGSEWTSRSERRTGSGPSNGSGRRDGSEPLNSSESVVRSRCGKGSESAEEPGRTVDSESPTSPRGSRPTIGSSSASASWPDDQSAPVDRSAAAPGVEAVGAEGVAAAKARGRGCPRPVAPDEKLSRGVASTSSRMAAAWRAPTTSATAANRLAPMELMRSPLEPLAKPSTSNATATRMSSRLPTITAHPRRISSGVRTVLVSDQRPARRTGYLRTSSPDSRSRARRR